VCETNQAIVAAKAQAPFLFHLQAVDRYENLLTFGGDLLLLTSDMVRTSTGEQVRL
jgi:hypothetical protein